MLKIPFMIHFVLEVLRFKKSCNLIRLQHFGPWLENQNFAWYRTGDEITVTILVFILDYSQEKLMTKFNEKTLFLGYFASFFTKFAQKQTFPGKKGSAIFEIFQLSTTCKKSEKTNEPFLRKMPNWQADGQLYNGDFKGPSVWRGSNKRLCWWGFL